MVSKSLVLFCLTLGVCSVTCDPCFVEPQLTLTSTQLDCRFSEEIQQFPVNIADYTELTSITIISASNLFGTLPTEIGLLGKLEVFNVTGSRQLTGTIPTEFGTLSSLRRLELSELGVSGTIPTELGNLGQLEQLIVRGGNDGDFVLPASPPGRQLHGTIPSEIGKLTKLQYLAFTQHYLLGTVPITVDMKNLISLDLRSNRLSGTLETLTEVLRQLPNLGAVALSQNNFDGWIPEKLLTLPQVKALLLSNNKLKGSFPSSMWEHQLSMLQLDGCQLEGTIPANFSLTEESPLPWLSLRNNKLSGPLPNQFNNLFFVDLSHNKFTGTIPSAITNTFGLDFSHNLLKGTIPPQAFVYSTRIHNNDLTGTIPGSITSTQTASLHNNRLTGTLPEWTKNVLGSMNVLPNNFEGPVPIGDSEIRYCKNADCSKYVAVETISNVSFTGEYCSPSTVRCMSQRGVEQICSLNNVCCEVGTPRSCIECEPTTGRCLTPQPSKIVANNNTKVYVPPNSQLPNSLSSNFAAVVGILHLLFLVAMGLAVAKTWHDILKTCN